MRNGIALNSAHDIFVVNGSLFGVSNELVIARSLTTRLLTLKGEWFLNTSYGYEYSNVLGKRVLDLQLVESTLKSYILDTDGVTEITRFVLDFEPGNARKLTLTFTVISEYGVQVPIEGVTLG